MRRFRLSPSSAGLLLAGLLLTLGGVPQAMAQADPSNRPLWLRHPAVSPDGQHIAFVYGGQLWRVPAGGGEAVALTGAEFSASDPVWSPDSRSIAFSANRHGNADVFVMSAKGGEIRRLTTHSQADTPHAFSPDGKSVLFSSMRLGDPKVAFGGQLMGASIQLYSIPATGGRERLVIPIPALGASPGPDGRFILYTSLNAPENEWRKHAVSEATRDIWVYDTTAKTHRQLTTWRGEDRDAVFSADGKSVFWLNEQSGSFNVWKMAFEGDAKPVQLTAHQTHPVRFLSLTAQNDLVYGYDGEIWKLAHDAKEPQRVEVHISQGSLLGGTFFAKMNEEVSEIAANQDGSEIAVIARGEVFVVDAASGRTRRITNTPQHERNVSFRPDGKAVLYASERDGRYDVYETTIDAPDATSFQTPGALKETRLTNTQTDITEPAYSPDGQRIAYLEDRTSLVVMDLATKKTVTAMPKGLSYSYTDGDLPFVWSPDGRWLAATIGSAITSFNIALVDASGQKPPVNVTRSGFTSVGPQFSADGKVLLYLSMRDGLQTADSQGAELDVYATFLTQSAYDAVARSSDRIAAPSAEPKKTDAKPEEKKAAPAWEPELDDLSARTVRLTPFSSALQFFKLTPDGKSLVFASAGAATGFVGYKISLGKPGLAPLFTKAPPAAGGVATDGKGENAFFLGAGGIERVNLLTGAAATLPFTAEVAYDLQGEMRWFFEHVWRMTQQKFYRKDMAGVDWARYKTEYAKHLPHLRHGEDLAELLGEMAGELNSSHMGSRYQPKVAGGDATASLGLYYDHAHTGPGAKIADYLKTGPAGRADSLLRPGAIILAVNGEPIRADMDIHPLLNKTAGQPVRLSVQPAKGGAPVDEIVTPEPFANGLVKAHARWVAQRAQLTEELSKGRLCYIYVGLMDTKNYQSFIHNLRGRCADKEAVIVDVRFNGGGHLSERLIADLSAQSTGKSYDREGNVLADLPASRWTKPSAILANSSSYSDGSLFTHYYKHAKLGPFVGEPVPGTGTAVWWIQLLPGGRLQYGIPEIGSKSADGRFYENTEDNPDVLVRRSPDAIEEGRDEQLEAAVNTMLKQLDGK
jgi:tricorn protease